MRPRCLALVALAAAPTVAAVADGFAAVDRRVVLMGTEAEVRVEAMGRSAALAASEAAIDALERAEARLSTWAETSELARLNRAATGEPVRVSPELAAELAAAEACRLATGGAFDAGIGSLVEAWGVREGGRLPQPGELAAARSASGGDGLELRADGTALRRWPGLRMDEGGFGKGAALDAAVSRLVAVPAVASARLDLGGQIALYERPGGGRSPERAPTELAVAHPRERERPVVALAISSGSVATTGNSERGIRVAGERRSHVLDPRSGEPAPDFGSVTVWTSEPGSALRADCLSTGLFVLGPDAALAWAAAHPGVEALVLRSDGEALEARATPGLEGRLRTLDPGLVNEIRFVSGVQPPAQGAGIYNEKRSGGSPWLVADAATHRPRSGRGQRGSAQ